MMIKNNLREFLLIKLIFLFILNVLNIVDIYKYFVVFKALFQSSNPI